MGKELEDAPSVGARRASPENRNPSRKHVRLAPEVYDQAGYYFITICIERRRQLLGQVVGDFFTPSALGSIGSFPFCSML